MAETPVADRAARPAGTAEPLVKVIIPCYGYADLLEGCVRSVLRRQRVAVRVLIVDDCSPDDTPAVARRVAESDDRVEYRRHADNMGLIATANEGLEWAEDSDYVVLLSADDRLVPGSLDRAVDALEYHPEVGDRLRPRPVLRVRRPATDHSYPPARDPGAGRCRLDPHPLPVRPRLHLLS